MKTFSLTELRRNPVSAIAAVRKGRGIRITRRAQIIAEVEPANAMRANPLYDLAYLKSHVPPRPRPLKRGEAGVVKQLRQDRDKR